MAALDSRAVFQARARSFGLEDEDITALSANGWDTLGNFAFSCAYVPGSPDESAFLDKVVTPVLGADSPKAAALRRLFFEAYTMAAADLRWSVGNKSAGSPP